MVPPVYLVQRTLELPIRLICAGRLNYARNLSEELAIPLLFVISLPLPVALGFSSATRIDKSRGRLKGVSLSMAAIGIALMSGLLSGPFLGRRLADATRICKQIHIVRAEIRKENRILTNEDNLRQNITLLGAALFRYAETHNGRYPDPKSWCDEIIKTGCLQSNASLDWLARKKHWPYAMNPNCSPNSPGQTVLLFERSPGWNRYGGWDLFKLSRREVKGVYVLLNNNGQVKFVRPGEFTSLRFYDDQG